MTATAPRLSCVIVFLNAGQFLGEAIESVARQTWSGFELLLVDDGSTDDSTRIAREAEAGRPGQIRYLEHAGHANLGESASRNLGLSHAKGEFITFLDSDDVLLPDAFRDELEVITAQPDVALAYGRFERWYSWTGDPVDSKRDVVSDPGVPGDARYEGPELLSVWLRNESAVPANCSLILRTKVVAQVGGFEESFSRIPGDDLVLYSKILVDHPAYVATQTWSRYRQHPGMSVASSERTGQWHATRPNQVRQQYLTWLDGYLRRRGQVAPALREELDRQLRPYRHATLFRAQTRFAALTTPARRVVVQVRRRLARRTTGRLVARPNPIRTSSDLGRAKATISWSATTDAVEVHVGAPDGNLFAKGGATGSATTDQWVVDGTRFYLQDATRDRPTEPANTLDWVTVRVLTDGSGLRIRPAKTPRVGHVRFGDLARPMPISRDWGYERGTSVARWYIERFIAARAADIRGRVLEVGDDAYTRRFGGSRVERSDVLNVKDGVPGTTVVADLADAPQIASDTYDCVICVQTLQLIYDVPAAVRTLERILKPGGVALVTVPGVAPTAGTWRDVTYWKFTPVSAARLFGDAFGAPNVTVSGGGNALAAVAHLHGLVVEDLRRDALDWREEGYEVAIAIRAVKPLPVER